MIAEIIVKTLIVWSTISTTSPVRTHNTLMYFDTCNQVGTEYLVTVAEVNWKGQKKEIELERQLSPMKEQLTRSIVCEGQGYITIH